MCLKHVFILSHLQQTIVDHRLNIKAAKSVSDENGVDHNQNATEVISSTLSQSELHVLYLTEQQSEGQVCVSKGQIY